MKAFATKIISIFVVTPVLLLVALFSWLGGAGGGPKSLVGAVLGFAILFVFGIPVLILFGLLFGGFFLITNRSPQFQKRVKAMEKTL